MMSSLARKFLVHFMRPEKKIDITEEKKFKNEVAAITPNMGNIPNSMVQTKFGSCPMVLQTVINCTESNFPVYFNISAVTGCPDPNFDINSYP